MHRIILPVVACALVLAAAPARADHFSAKFSGFEEIGGLGAGETGAILSEGKGSLVLDLDRHAQTLTFTLEYSGLSAPVTQSHIHFGKRHVAGGIEDIAYITLFFESNLIAHIHVNWLAPVKIRHTLIGGNQKMIVYNDLEPVEKVRVYDKGIIVSDDPESINQIRIGYRTGEMRAPKVDTTEALQTEALHFVRCITHKERPTTDGEAGLRVISILEAATQSIADRGRPVELAGGGAVI